MTTTIKNISLLLTRYGTSTDYDCIVDIYQASDYGIPIGLPLGSSTKSAADIDFTSYYNFIFDPVISTELTNLVVVFHQTISDSNNFIIWIHTEQETTSDWAISTDVDWGDLYAYGYGYIYGYGELVSLDFFDVFALDSAVEKGYALTSDYGFEYTPWKSDPYIKRCYKVYDEFNEIIFDGNSAFIKLPGSSEQSITYSNRQALYSGYKQNVAITDDSVTLQDLGRRILFCDTHDDDPKWMPTNRNLSTEVLCATINKQYSSGSSNTAYNCFMVAGTAEGIFYSSNSGGDWVQITNASVLNKRCVAICFKNSYGEPFYAAVKNDSSYEIYSFNTFAGTPTLITTESEEVKCLFYSSYLSDLIYGTTNKIHTNSTDYLTGNSYNRIRYHAASEVVCCGDGGTYLFDLATFVGTLVDGGSYGETFDCQYYSESNRHYLATATGILVSTATGTSLIATTWVGDDPTVTPYLVNVNKNNTTALGIDSTNNILFVAQLGGVCYTESGNVFSSLENNLSPDTDIIELLVNPIDERLIHVLSRTTKNKYPFFTFIIDQSGDMNLSSYNPFSLLKDIGDNINTNYSDAKFEVISFGTMEKESLSGFDRKGAVNLTEGYVSWSNVSATYFSVSPNYHYRTPLYETLYVTFKGIYDEGVYWYYDDASSKVYKFDEVHNELFTNSPRIVILATTGRDTNSLKTLENVINGQGSYPGIDDLDIKLYILAVGEQADLQTLENLNIPDYELIHLRDENVTDYNAIVNYISNKEKYRYREGFYRKSYYSENPIFVKDFSQDITLLDNTTIQARYRYSNNKYDLGDFTDYYSITTNNQSIAIDQVCKYFEVEYKLKSYLINSSPSINSITINYHEASISHLILNTITKSTTDEALHQIQVSTNFGVQYHSSGDYFHFLDQYYYGIPLVTDIQLSPSDSFHSEVFESIGIDQRSVINRRYRETTTTNDYIVYSVTNGAWDQKRTVSVYNGSTLIASTKYYLNPQKGRIIFLNPMKSSDVIYVTIEDEEDFRLEYVFDNLDDETYIKLDNLVLEYLLDSETILTRTAIPLLSSQISDDTASAIQVASKVSGNLDQIVAGNNAYITSTFVIKTELSIGSKILLGFGEFVDIPDEDTYYFRQHEISGITGLLQTSSTSLDNYVKIVCSRAGVNFAITTSSELENFLLITTSGGSLKKNDIVTFYIGGLVTTNSGYKTTLTRSSETEYIISENVVGGLRTFLALGYGTSPTSSDLKKSLPEINFSATRSASKLHIAAPMTPSSTTFDVRLTITDDSGIIAEKATPTVSLTIINLVTADRTDLGSVTFIESDNGSLTKSVSVSDDGYYQISALNLTSGYSTLSNAIIVGQDIHIYFGDFNVKSALGTGRQSPSFVYEYAKNKAGLDFVAIADSADNLTATEWEWHQDIASYYNVEGEFVVFLGSEWQSTEDNVGHRAIIFKGDTVPLISKLTTSTLEVLYNNLSGYRAFVFALYPGYDETDYADLNVDWSALTTKIQNTFENSVEVYSEHGNSESYELQSTNGLISPATATSNSYIADAYRLGIKLSMIGTSNSNISRPGLYAGELLRSNLPLSDSSSSEINNRGLTAIYAPNLSREALFESIKQGHVYATTGARIYLNFYSDTALMGETINVVETYVGVLSANPTFKIYVIPTTSYANVYLMRVIVGETTSSLTTIKTISVSSVSGEQTMVDTTLTSERKDAVYFIRVVQEDNHMAWSSPIYMKYITTSTPAPQATNITAVSPSGDTIYISTSLNVPSNYESGSSPDIIYSS